MERHMPHKMFNAVDLADATSAACAAGVDMAEAIKAGTIEAGSNLANGETALYLADALLTALRHTGQPNSENLTDIIARLGDCRNAAGVLIDSMTTGGAA